MVHQCLGCLNDLLAQFSYQLADADLDFSHTSKVGRKLANLTEQADTMFGGIIIVELFLNLLNSVCSIFFAIGLDGIYGFKTDVKPAGAVFGISFLVLAIFSMFRNYSIQKCGQNLANVFSDIR